MCFFQNIFCSLLDQNILVIDSDHAKVIDRESNRMDQWRIRKAIHIRKELDKSMN